MQMERPGTACSTFGCPKEVVVKGKCADHQDQPVATPGQTKREISRELYRPLYKTRRWTDRVRPAVLRRDPVCVCCHRKPSLIAHHKIDHRGDLRLFYDINNIEGVCKGCHDEITGAAHGAGNREPDKPALTEDGRVIEYGAPPKIDVTFDTSIDFVAKIREQRR